MAEKKLPKRVEIQFEDLSPRVQDAIINVKIYRISMPIFHIINVGFIVFVSSVKDAPVLAKAGAIALGSYGTMKFRQDIIDRFQKSHIQIAQEMQHGIFVSSAEKHYPDGWINPSTVGKTHPIFFVKGNKNIVFVQPTRDEYFRWKYQQHKILGGLGLVAWRWRQEIAPPKVPVKVRDWAKARIKKIYAKVKDKIPEPVPVPHPVPVLRKERRTRIPERRY